MNNISFHSADRVFKFRGIKNLKKFIALIFATEKKNFNSLNYIFCSDNYLLGINQSFLKHDYFTDIITFNLSEIKTNIEGEIYISLDRVKDNAETLQTKEVDELLRVIFHGALHLCGYNDKKKTERLLMRKMEDHYLDLFKISF
jgi:rRNA maturation RNase YbeY